MVKWLLICEPKLRCIPLHLVIFFIASTVQHYQANNRHIHLINFGKKKKKITLSLQLEMQCLFGEERGKVECTWRKTEVHPCRNPGKAHSCWGSSTIVVRSAVEYQITSWSFAPNHHARSACMYLLLGLLWWRWQQKPPHNTPLQTAVYRNLYALIQLMWPARPFEVQDKPL